ncbi:MAG: tRNA pseudouridine synthase B [Chlamydiae bacterium]|nr:tRNA pseudouridine synthase B [Chlamydiota bacterium]
MHESKTLSKRKIPTPEDSNSAPEGILPIYKPRGPTAFQLVRLLRKHLGVRKIGHAGTLDPFAEGVMVLLVGRKYTRLSDALVNTEKEYIGRVVLGIETDTYDVDGKILHRSDLIPSLEEVTHVLNKFQGKVQQIPPMFSAKKKDGKKLYELARKGKTIERDPVTVELQTELLEYHYPYLDIRVTCSKGTYIRALAHDIGTLLTCGGHLTSLTRTRSGKYSIADCFDGSKLQSPDLDVEELCGRLLSQ